MIIKPDKILYGKDEFYKGINDKLYKIYKIDSSNKEIFMVKVFKYFLKHQKLNTTEQHYVGIDFEFNKISKTFRDIALMQINIENLSPTAYIFIFNPLNLTSKSNKTLIKLLTKPYIIKILHGSESLDIPYLFNQLLIKKKYVIRFNNNFYDTKFICEYLNLQNEINMGCSIYDLLLYNNIISSEQINKLNDIEAQMGPIYLIHIDVNNMNDELFLYALYDVIYLPELVKKLFNSMNNSSIKLISELLAIINNYKRNIDKHFIKLESTINSMNNYYFYTNNIRYKLQDVWSKYYEKMTSNYYINLCKSINYFKNFFKIITKYIIYYNISKLTRIKQNHTQYYSNDISDSYLSYLKQYPIIYNLLDEINKFILIDFNQWINTYLKK